MSSYHPDPAALERFMKGESEPQEGREVVRHLLAGCDECRREARRHAPGAQPPASSRPSAWAPEGVGLAGDAMARVQRDLVQRSASLATERAEALGLFRELESLPPGRQSVLVRNSRRFQTWTLAELVLAEAFEARSGDVQRYQRLAELGLALAQSLDEATYTAPLVADLEARAWAYLGNALRILTRLRAADQAFRRARKLLDEGTSDPLEEARVLALQASLRDQQGRPNEAIALASRAARIYLQLGEEHLAGRTLIAKCAFMARDGRTDSAVADLERALELIEPEREPYVTMAGHHNLVHMLHNQGKNQEALKLLAKAQPVYRKFGKPQARWRLRWLEAKIALALGRPREAEHALLQVRDGFFEAGIYLDAAVACLELAHLYLGQGRLAEVRELAAWMVPIFKSQEVHREVLAALSVFRRAVEEERLTAGLVQSVAEYLEQSPHNPQRKFEPPSRS